jgi:hypothetical protein
MRASRGAVRMPLPTRSRNSTPLAGIAALPAAMSPSLHSVDAA